ncbi:MAG: hypothetical protein LBQ22_13110 [Bacteroidales bacterium]|nr:hypothetical protein [Bacteroidales bacterium]
MAKRINNVEKMSINSLLTDSHTIVTQLIPDSVAKADVHYCVEVANKKDPEWFIAIPKTNKIRNMREVIEKVVATQSPPAIAVTIYSNEKTEHTRLYLKLDNTYVPAVDGEEPEDYKKPNKVHDTTDELTGLGTIGNLMIDNNRIRFENQIENLKTQYNSEKKLHQLEHQNTVRELNNVIDRQEKEIEELKEDLAEATITIEQYEKESAEKNSDFDNVKKSGLNLALMGIASKVFGIEASELSGLFGSGESPQSTPIQQPKNAEFEIEQPELPESGINRNEEIAVIIDFLQGLEPELMQKVIGILQSIAVDNSLADTILELITQNV